MVKPATTAPPLAVKWRKLAEARCAAAGERLTPARLAAYAELLASKRPVSAYELIALLEESGRFRDVGWEKSVTRDVRSGRERFRLSAEVVSDQEVERAQADADADAADVEEGVQEG